MPPATAQVLEGETTPAAPAAPAAPVTPTPPAATAAPAAGTGSVLQGVPSTTPTQDWPDDWRERAAAGDEKAAKRFARYTSPADALKALVEAQNKISAGIKPAALPENATDEERAQWRADNGIPATPDEYDLTLPGGLAIGEADKEVIADFLKHAHGADMRPEQVKSSLAWYYETQERQAQEQAQADAAMFQATEEELRQEWGGDYRRNVNLASTLLDNAPPGVKENLLGARLADGTALGNSPGVLRWLASLSRELNPLATVVPGSGATAAAAVETEIAALEARMGGDEATRKAYFKDEKAQARYRELVSARAAVR